MLTLDALQPRMTAWTHHRPTPPQAAFLSLNCQEALYGGAGGGGKTDALLMAAAQWVDIPGYAALLLRRTYADLALPGAIMDRALAWWGGTAVRWSDDTKTFTFPSGATITFGYLHYETDKYRYQGAEFQFIAFDELTQFTETMYTYLFSRLRKPASGPVYRVPLRQRGASNPGGEGHEWVKQRFLSLVARAAGRVFIPARIADNPYLDAESYRASLAELDPVTRAQIEDGNWDVLPTGDLFLVEKLVALETVPTQVISRVRYWDKAGTEAGGKYTAGVRISRTRRGLYAAEYIIEDVVRGQWSSGRRNAVIKSTAADDPHGTVIYLEQEPGSGGKESGEISVSDLAGYDVHLDRVTGDKVTRARPLAAQIEAGAVGYVLAAWNSPYKAELRAAPNGVYWDQIDGSSGAFNKVALNTPPEPARAGGQRPQLPGNPYGPLPGSPFGRR